jgi:hypothetical protein
MTKRILKVILQDLFFMFGKIIGDCRSIAMFLRFDLHIARDFAKTQAVAGNPNSELSR